MLDTRLRVWRYAAFLLLSVATLLVANGVDPTSALLTGTKTVTGNALATASTFCKQPSLTFLTGLEYGPISGLGPFDSSVTTGGTPTADAAVKRNGGYSAKVPKTSAGGSSISKSLSGTSFTVRLGLYLDSLPTANVAQLLTFGVASGSAANLRYNASTHKLELAFGNNTATVAASAASAATWYLVDVKVDVSTNPRTASWRIDGVAQTAASAAETASTVSSLVLGSGTTADVFTAHYDDIALAAGTSAYPIGDGKVLAVSPNSSATANHNTPADFQTDANGAIDSTAYTRVDEVPMSSTADYVKQVTALSTAYLQLDFADTTSTCINGVRATVAMHAAGTAANVAVTKIYDGSTATTVYSGTVGSTSLVYKSAMVTPTASTWTASALNGLVARVGYSTDVSPVPYWDALQLEYDASAV